MTSLIGSRLRARVRDAGSDPLLTYYEPDSGVRVELSAITFTNWVDKTSNLIMDELLLDAGDIVELDVARTAPGHWMTACWQVACWQVGVVVSVASGQSPNVLVTGPEYPERARVDIMACSLHPLGLGLGGALPPGVQDYATEVRGQPDSYAPSPVSGLAPAWADPVRQLTQAELVTGLDDSPRRRLVRPGEPWETADDGILTALVTGGSYVMVVGGDDAALARIIATERVDG